MKLKDPYRLPEGYLFNPFNYLYQDDDLPISSNPAIKETIQSILDIDEDRLDLDLSYIEHLIQLDSLAYVRKGCLFATILFKKLYKNTHSNFKLYSEQILGRSESSVRIEIEASRVTLELIRAGLEYSDYLDISL